MRRASSSLLPPSLRAVSANEASGGGIGGGRGGAEAEVVGHRQCSFVASSVSTCVPRNSSPLPAAAESPRLRESRSPAARKPAIIGRIEPAMIHQADTIVEILCRRIETDGPQPALAVKRGGQYQLADLERTGRRRSPRLAAVLVELGVQPGDRVAQLSENRYEWIIADLAIQMAGAIHVPIHAPLTGLQIAWQVRHSGAKVLLLSGRQQAAKLARAGRRAACRTWLCVAYDACPEPLCGPADRHARRRCKPRPIWRKGIDAACQTRKADRGRVAGDDPLHLRHHRRAQGRDAHAGQPGRRTACATIEAFGYRPDHVRLNFLPLSHIFARTCDLYCWLAEGSRMAMAESRETVIADCQAIHPTYLNGVPYFYDKVYRGLCEKGVQRLPGALQGVPGRRDSNGAAPAERRCPITCTTISTARACRCCRATACRNRRRSSRSRRRRHHRRGSCGRAIPGIEVRDRRRRRNPHPRPARDDRATTKTRRPRPRCSRTAGWPRATWAGSTTTASSTSPAARRKSWSRSGGKNIAPVFLESLLTQDPLILQAMVVGDGRSYLAALIVPNQELLEAELARRGGGRRCGCPASRADRPAAGERLALRAGPQVRPAAAAVLDRSRRADAQAQPAPQGNRRPFRRRDRIAVPRRRVLDLRC